MIGVDPAHWILLPIWGEAGRPRQPICRLTSCSGDKVGIAILKLWFVVSAVSSKIGAWRTPIQAIYGRDYLFSGAPRRHRRSHLVGNAVENCANRSPNCKISLTSDFNLEKNSTGSIFRVDNSFFCKKIGIQLVALGSRPLRSDIEIVGANSDSDCGAVRLDMTPLLNAPID